MCPLVPVLYKVLPHPVPHLTLPMTQRGTQERDFHPCLAAKLPRTQSEAVIFRVSGKSNPHIF